MLTVVTWKWRGWRGNMYEPRHVMAMEQMLKKHLHVPHRFVCVTDDPRGLECETMPIWNYPIVDTGAGQANCYRRLRVFAKEAAYIFGPRLLSIDLDAIIVDDITSLITEDDLRLVKGKAAPYNGSMFLHNTGTRLTLWDEFDKNSRDVVRRHERQSQVRHYGSDQAWISYKSPGEPVWSERDGVYHYTLLGAEGVPTDAKIIFFAGGQKPWSLGVKQKFPELYQTYMAYLEQSLTAA